MNALKQLPEPQATHGPATRVEISQYHAGQIVTPIVRAWRKGKSRYLVQVSAYDASDRTYATPVEFVGDFWACVRFCRDQGIRGADVDC